MHKNMRISKKNSMKFLLPDQLDKAYFILVFKLFKNLDGYSSNTQQPVPGSGIGY
jgi:hypothetical protein